MCLVKRGASPADASGLIGKETLLVLGDCGMQGKKLREVAQYFWLMGQTVTEIKHSIEVPQHCQLPTKKSEYSPSFLLQGYTNTNCE